jgi:hypothetical protein
MSSRPMLPVILVIACFIGLILSSTLPVFAQNTSIDSFNDAKKRMTQIFAGHETTFYCGCAYTGNEVNIVGSPLRVFVAESIPTWLYTQTFGN